MWLCIKQLAQDSKPRVYLRRDGELTKAHVTDVVMMAKASLYQPVRERVCTFIALRPMIIEQACPLSSIIDHRAHLNLNLHLRQREPVHPNERPDRSMILEKLLCDPRKHLRRIVMLVDVIRADTEDVVEWVLQSSIFERRLNVLPCLLDLLGFVVRELHLSVPAAWQVLLVFDGQW